MDYQCQKTFDIQKEAFMKNPLYNYQDPSKLYTLFMDTSKYAWSANVTQEHASIFDGKTIRHQHTITYVSRLFQSSQLTWATLTTLGS